MMYCYDSATIPTHNEHDYWSISEVEQIAIYEATPRIQRIMQKDNDCTLYPISDYEQYSWEFANCADEKEAFDKLMQYLNQNVYEYINDL